jgi:RNA polymerase sigma factor (sigma-70 family)
VLTADREAFAVVYDRYGSRLYDFAYSMLRHREDAADAVADSFVLFAERLIQLREPDRLRPWLYAIVRSECLRRLKARKRVAYGDEEQLIEMADDATTPHEAAERAALQQLVWDASAGLADRDRALLDLHLRQGLEGAELGEAMGVSASNAYVMLNRLRAQVDRSLGALLIARLGRDDCDELDALLVDWDGSFSPLIRKRVARHVDQCDVCSERRKKMVSPWALLAAVPMFAAPLSLRDRVLEDTELVAYRLPGEDTPAGTGGHRWGGGRVTVAAAALLVLAVVATVLLWPDPNKAAAPVQATPTAPAVSTAPAQTLSPPASESPSASASESASPDASPTPSETPSQVPGTLTASTRTIDLGRTSSRSTVGVTNTGDLPVSYRVSSGTRWLSVAPATGEVAGGGSARIAIRADRSKVRVGRSTGSILIAWDGGSVKVSVSLEEHAPAVGAPQAEANPSCRQRTVSVTARVTDASGLASVTLTWTGPNGAGSATMSGSGSTWTAPMGPFTLGGDITMQVHATDRYGHTTTGPAGSASATPCPQ